MNLPRFLRLAALSLTLCLPAAAAETADAFVASIEEAHNAAAYRQHAAVEAGFEVVYPGMLELRGTVLFDTPAGRSRMTLDDGSVWVHDGSTAWVAPGSPSSERARFHLLTWPYFFAAFSKLNDPGTHREAPVPLPVKDADDVRHGVKLTFDDGVGDSPDDWYHAFRGEGGRLDALAYIVSYGKDAAAAEASPSVCLYTDFEEVEGVTVPVAWSTYRWSPDSGIAEDGFKGETTFTDVRFVDPPADAFVAPEGATEQALPGS